MKKIKYPLVEYPFSKSDILSGRKVLSLGKIITMGEITKKFEKKFAKYLGVKYALMVNSGSSANLLAFFALINPLLKKKYRQIVNASYQQFAGLLLCGQLSKQD